MRFTVLLEPERDLEIVKSVTISTLKKIRKTTKKNSPFLVIRPGSPRKLKTAFGKLGKVETEDSNTKVDT